MNVKVERIQELDALGEEKRGEFVRFSPQLVASLPRDQTFCLRHEDFSAGERQKGRKPSYLSERLKPFFLSSSQEGTVDLNLRAEVTVEFQNIEMQSYVVKEAISYGKIEIISHKGG